MVKLYHAPLGEQADAAHAEAFNALATPGRKPGSAHRGARNPACARSAGVVWFDFKTLCGGPRSQNDYLEIATQFHTVLLSMCRICR
jgi:cell division protein ZapE